MFSSGLSGLSRRRPHHSSSSRSGTVPAAPVAHRLPAAPLNRTATPEPVRTFEYIADPAGGPVVGPSGGTAVRAPWPHTTSEVASISVPCEAPHTTIRLADVASHQIALSDGSSSESDAEDHRAKAICEAAVAAPAPAATGAPTAAAAAQHSRSNTAGTRQSSRPQQKRQASSNQQHRGHHAAAAPRASLLTACSSSGHQQSHGTPKTHNPKNLHSKQRLSAGLQPQSATPQAVAAAARKLSAVTVPLLLLVLVGASSTLWAVTRMQQQPRLMTSLGSSSSGSSSNSDSSSTGSSHPAQAATAAAAGAAGSTTGRVLGAVGGLLGSTFRAASVSATTGKATTHSPAAAAAAATGPGGLPAWLNPGTAGKLHSAVGRVLSMHTGSSSSRGTGSISSSSGSSKSTPRPLAAAAAGDAAAAAAAVALAAGKAAPAGDIMMYAVVDDAVISPYKGADWGAVIRHMSKRLAWSNERFNLQVLTQQQLKQNPEARDRLSKAISSSSSTSSSRPIFVGIAISDPDVASFLGEVTAQLPTALFWDSPAGDLNRVSRVDGFAPAAASPVAQLLAKHVGFSGEARAAKVLHTLDSLWGRHTSDDLLFIWLVLLNEYITPVSEVANTTKGTDLASLWCMIKNCGQKIVDCVQDTRCKAGLDCLEGCAFNDQVCQYRCIVSYETPKFEQFALCILQLHNCRGLDAKMPITPDPAPMATWRGAPLTHEAAEALFIGWRQDGPQLPPGGGEGEGGEVHLKPYSWLVAAGKNPAYDFFPCQHQLYSYGKGKGQLWYEPVFKAITLDGAEVWRRRRYRVRRGTTPGTFHYSVLDNGVTSNEYWRILDCADDLTYCLFYYSGAAAAAGLSYSGAVLATVDGLWPAAHTSRIHDALATAGIEPWELSSVDNSQCIGAPL